MCVDRSQCWCDVSLVGKSIYQMMISSVYAT